MNQVRVYKKGKHDYWLGYHFGIEEGDVPAGRNHGDVERSILQILRDYEIRNGTLYLFFAHLTEEKLVSDKFKGKLKEELGEDLGNLELFVL